MRGKSFIPGDYDVFTGLDVSKKSMSVTFTNHQGFIRSLNMPHKVEPLLHYVRKHFPDQKIAFVYEAGPTGYGLWAGGPSLSLFDCRAFDDSQSARTKSKDQPARQ